MIHVVYSMYVVVKELILEKSSQFPRVKAGFHVDDAWCFLRSIVVIAWVWNLTIVL